MDKAAVIEKLRGSQPQLRAEGVVHLRVFGSVARGDNSAGSDIDLLAELETGQRRTLVKMARLQSLLTDVLDAPVDLAIAGNMRESIRERVQREAILAF
jgi:hypothetical protein